MMVATATIIQRGCGGDDDPFVVFVIVIVMVAQQAVIDF